jgi:hypothetical protein
MRLIAMSDERRGGMAAAPVTEPRGSSGQYCLADRGYDPIEKNELASLLPGGQTHGAGSERDGSGDTSSPEPVIGYGATKGIDAYYLAVLRFGSPIDTY